MIPELKVGQQWLMNRDRTPWNKCEMTLHVLAIFTDKAGKHKVAIQGEFPRHSEHSAPHYEMARLVTPQYFYGLTIKINPTK